MNPVAQAPEEPPAQPPAGGAVVQQPANAPAPLNKEQGRKDMMATMAVLGAVLIGVAIVLSVLRYWTRRQTHDGGSPAVSLSSFREMYENGELSEEEYEQIRNKMAAKMKNKLGVKLPPAVKPKPDVGRNGTPPAPESES